MKNRLELIKKKKKSVKVAKADGSNIFEGIVTGVMNKIEEKQEAEELLKEQEDIAREEQELEKLKVTETKDRGLLDLKSLRDLFERVDYNTFCLIVTIGNIRGRHLLALDHGSKKLREYCSRPFQPVDKDGKLIGHPQMEYLFEVLLNRIGIIVPNDKTPREAYFERMVGGQVWCFGSNNVGQLGLRGIRDRKVPVLNPDLKDIIKVCASGDQALCLDGRGRVWCFGHNGLGQLGLGDNKARRIPRMIPSLVNIIEVSVNHLHSLCVDNQGRVWTFGSNSSGQLGLGDTINRNYPELIPNLEKIIHASTGMRHSVCLDVEGHVWSFGDNSNGKLGNGQWTETIDATPHLIPDLNGIIQICCGAYHTLCLDNLGMVKGFGINSDGELGYPTFTPVVALPILVPNLRTYIIKISAGAEYSLCLDCHGCVWVFGKNTNGQLGLNDDQRKTIEPNQFFTEDVFENVKAKHPPDTKFGKVTLPTRIPSLENIVDISCGYQHSLCLDNEGRVWAFGSNRYGQCALDNTKWKNPPIIIPNLHTVVQVSAATMSSICLIRKQ